MIRLNKYWENVYLICIMYLLYVCDFRLGAWKCIRSKKKLPRTYWYVFFSFWIKYITFRKKGVPAIKNYYFFYFFLIQHREKYNTYLHTVFTWNYDNENSCNIWTDYQSTALIKPVITSFRRKETTKHKIVFKHY